MSYGSRRYGSSSYGGGYGRGGGAYGGGDFSNSGLGGGLQNRRSSTCYGKSSGTLLTEYDTEQDAQSGAAFVLERYGNSMVSYQCDTCGFWHLSPMDRRLPHSTMSQNRRSSTCYGKASGTLLTEYDSEQDAQSGAAFVLERYGKSMVSYQCNECRFWHLSPMMDRRVVHSSSCYGKVSGKALAQYDTKHDAQSAAANVLKEHRKKMVPYKCQGCCFWHLSPIERQTKHSSWSCSCVDESGSDKDCYKSKADAQRRAQILKKEMGMHLNVYCCPETEEDDYVCIWHLTKKDPQQYAVSRKSTSCTNAQGSYRMEYDTEDDATDGAKHAYERYGREFSAYLCLSCGKWHIGGSAERPKFYSILCG